jgi:2-dehydro-3-deoxyphosphogalactonate aldolase
MPDVASFERHFAAVPLVAILRGLTSTECDAIGEVLIEAGIRVLEVPLNSPEPCVSIGRLAERFSSVAAIGAGTVTSVEDVAAVATAGARFMVSPNTDLAVIRAARAAGLASMPGFYTPSEAFAALAAGADVLKLFPADTGGPGHLKALSAVLPASARVAVVGGVDADSLAGWRAAGAAGFGIGSWLYKPGRGAAEVGARARELVAAWRTAA